MAVGGRKMASDRRKHPVVTGCALILLGLFSSIVLVFLVYLSLVAVGAVLIVADPIENFDAVVILSGDDGNRLGMAADMMDRGYVYRLVITNTDRRANRLLASEAETYGFSQDSIFITSQKVDSTRDEALAVLQIARDQGWSSLMIVTDPFHSFRTRLIFRNEMRGSGVSISVRPVVGHWFRSRSWFMHREGWRVVFMEIAKLFSYIVFHFK